MGSNSASITSKSGATLLPTQPLRWPHLKRVNLTRQKVNTRCQLAMFREFFNAFVEQHWNYSAIIWTFTEMVRTRDNTFVAILYFMKTIDHNIFIYIYVTGCFCHLMFNGSWGKVLFYNCCIILFEAK